jgi:hypothetical protein
MICFYIYHYMCYVCCDHSHLTDFWIYGMQLVCMTAQLYFCCKHMSIFLPVTTRASEYHGIKYWNASQDNTWSVIALFQLLDLCGADIASIKSRHDRVCLLSLPCHMRRYSSCRILITFYFVNPVFCLMSLFVIFNQELFVCPAWSDKRTTLQRIVGRTSVLLLIWGCEYDCDCGWQKTAAAEV